MSSRRGEAAPVVRHSWRGRLLNFALYQVGWFACVLGAARGHPWTGAAIALLLIAAHVALARRPWEELALVLCAAGIGAVADSVQAQMGMIRFRSGSLAPWICPPWIVALWMQFATLLRFSLSWVKGRYLAASLLGLVGGPLAFSAGARLGAADLHPDRALSLVSIGIVWAAAFPLLVLLAERLGASRGSYRWLDPAERSDSGAPPISRA
jgi:hypothetical protein